MSFLIASRSEDPREFLIEHLEQVKVSQESGVRGPNVFDNSNLDAVFGMLDPANQKYITFAQYKQGEWCWSLSGKSYDVLLSVHGPLDVFYSYFIDTFKALNYYIWNAYNVLLLNKILLGIRILTLTRQPCWFVWILNMF